MNLLNKLEAACKGLVESLAITGLTSHEGQDNTEKAQPVVVCEAGRATEDFPESGIYHIPLMITVAYAAADYTQEDINTASATIFEAFLSANTITNLKAQEEGFDIYQILVAGQDTSSNEDVWLQTLQLEVVAVLT